MNTKANTIVKFGNDGLIQKESFTMFGISAKDSDNPIGEFGTGLKYAIAVLLRNGRKIWIDSGGETFNFTARPFDFRGEKVSRIFCNDEPTSFTTELGKKWELWQAYRELLSNCYDEGGDINHNGETTVHAELGDINVDDVFLRNPPEPVAKTDDCIIYDRPSQYMYRRGIRCYSMPCAFTYDLPNADLTEDRTLRDMHYVNLCIANCIAGSENNVFIRNIIKSTVFEKKLDFDWGSISPSQVFIDEVVAAHKKGILFNTSMLALVYKQSDKRVEHTDVDISKKQKETLERAIRLLEFNGYTVSCKIRVVNTLPDNVLGRASLHEKTAYLSIKLFDESFSEFVVTLLEEILHIKHRFEDYTRDMQNVLFDEIFRLMDKSTC